MTQLVWLLFVAQLPAQPSSARVQLWRVVRVVEGTRVRLLERVLVRDVDVAAVRE